MNESERCALVEKPHGTYTFKGKTAIVSGWRSPEASVTTRLPGFYHASWQEIKRAAESDGVIKLAYQRHVDSWLGCKSEGES